MAIQAKGCLRLVGGFFFLVGLALLAGAGWSVNRQMTILKTWPKTEAQVTKSQLTKSQDKDGDWTYGTAYEFRYTVNGKEYNTPSRSSYQTSNYTGTKRQLDAFAPGTTHTILYNPADPNDIRFDAGHNFGFFLLAFALGVVGLPFSLVGAGLLLASRGGTAGPVCPSCFRSAGTDASFCPHCGAPLAST